MGRSGTGLGMSVVWGTIKDHVGYIDIQTQEGQGTTFVLYFPASRLRLEASVPAHIDDYLGKGESILVIDDAAEQRQLTTEMLKRLGYRADSASSGEEAVRLIRKQTYDLLILDMIMPDGMNGPETYRHIISVNPRQKAVIASGYAETDQVRATQRLGAGAYVKKPYTLEQIGLAVRSELDKA
jgi:CheY-like chemotaxis protein